jgi:hypothetical protein
MTKTTEAFYYLSLSSSEFVVLRGQEGTARLGLIGAQFTTQAQAAEYARALNAEAQREPDNDTEGS